MVDYTPYLRLAKPPFDEIPWDEAVNGNMDTIDAFTSVFMQIPNFAGAWANDTQYITGQNVLDISDGLIYTAQVSFGSSPAPTTFAQERASFPTFWLQSYPAPPAVSQTYNNVGRNKLHNSQFGIWQRGYGPFVAASGNYTADRWQVIRLLDTMTITKMDANDTDRAEIASQSPHFYLQADVVGDPDGSAYSMLRQQVEDVRRLAGRTVTLSFWAKASSVLSVGINMMQYFGTGGAPSANVMALNPGIKVDLTTTWARYTATMFIPSVAGKTLGSNFDTGTYLDIFTSAGAASEFQTGHLPVQSGSFMLWGMQLELGNVATPFEERDNFQALGDCMRFFQQHVAWVPAVGSDYAYIPWPVSMHRSPTITGGGAGFATLNTSIFGVNVRQTAAAVQILNVSAEPP